MKIVGIIPSRYKSSRFPGKPLADINNHPMVWWVYQRAMKAKELDNVYVATDDNRIFDVCVSYNIPVIMTSPECANGTERVCEASKSVSADFYVNIQGDEPLIEPENIDKIAGYFRNHPDSIMATLKTRILDPVDTINCTITKVVCDLNDNAMYLTRSPVPYPKAALGYPIFRHIGLYGYRKDILQAYPNMEKGVLEKAEDIESLRFMEHGYKITVIETQTQSIAIDTEKDLARVCEAVKNSNLKD